MRKRIIAELIETDQSDLAIQLICAELSSRNYQLLISLLKPLGRKQLSELVENELIHALSDEAVVDFMEHLKEAYPDVMPKNLWLAPQTPAPSPSQIPTGIPNGLTPLPDVMPHPNVEIQSAVERIKTALANESFMITTASTDPSGLVKRIIIDLDMKQKESKEVKESE